MMVTLSFFNLKLHRNKFLDRLLPGPAGSLQRMSRPLTELIGVGNGWERKGMEDKEWGGWRGRKRGGKGKEEFVRPLGWISGYAIDACAAPAHGGDCISGVGDVITSHGNDEFLLSFSLLASCRHSFTLADTAPAAAAVWGPPIGRETATPSSSRMIYVS